MPSAAAAEAVGFGEPWKRTRVQPGEPSDPFLMTGYDHKELELQHDADKAVTFALEADLCGDGQCTVVQDFVVPSGDTVRHVFPRGWSAYWVRLRVDVACAATALRALVCGLTRESPSVYAGPSRDTE